MTRDAFKTIFDPLVIALRADFDLPTWTVYFRALEDVPVPLLMAAVERAVKSATFMPKPGELRTFAEDARKAWRASVVFEPCVNCSSGWIERDIDGVKRMVRCSCWAAHQERVGTLGVGSEPLAITQTYEPELDDCPSVVRDQIRAIASSRRMS